MGIIGVNYVQKRVASTLFCYVELFSVMTWTGFI